MDTLPQRLTCWIYKHRFKPFQFPEYVYIWEKCEGCNDEKFREVKVSDLQKEIEASES